MADNNFRSYRSHDPLARPGDRAPVRGQTADPLADLARLIGQSNPVDEFGRGAPVEPDRGVYDPEPTVSPDWVEDERYAAANEPAREVYNGGYQDDAERYEESFDPPPIDPVPMRRLDSGRDDARRYAAPPPHPRDEMLRPQDQPLPSFLPRVRDDRYDYADQEEDGAGDQSYAPDDYEEEAPQGRRRIGVTLVAAVLGLAVLGTAGVFAYRAMFGGAMLPSLPMIIKADTGPNKIVPNAVNGQGKASDQASLNGGSGEKLVSREEKPVDVPPPPSAAPRVVSTIPIFPAPDAQASGAPVVAPAAPLMPAPVQAPPLAGSASGAAAPLAAAAPAYAPMASAEPKKIHTVAIRPDQSNGASAATAASWPPATPAPASQAPAPAPRVTPPPRPAAPVAVRPAPPPQASSNAPLSILPGQQAGAPAAGPPRNRTALAQPTTLSPPAEAEAPATAGGGYAVQVTSQRSEAEAQAAFLALRAKYPAQLGGHEPLVRRADLGSKGVYYRALVGPFASMEQAAEVCSSLKAAGGACVVQRN